MHIGYLGRKICSIIFPRGMLSAPFANAYIVYTETYACYRPLLASMRSPQRVEGVGACCSRDALEKKKRDADERVFTTATRFAPCHEINPLPLPVPSSFPPFRLFFRRLSCFAIFAALPFKRTSSEPSPRERLIRNPSFGLLSVCYESLLQQVFHLSQRPTLLL